MFDRRAEVLIKALPTPTNHLLEIDAVRKILWDYGCQIKQGDVSDSMISVMRARLGKIIEQLDYFDKNALNQAETVIIAAQIAPELPLEPHEIKKAQA